jgi:hypothetical protein
MNNDTMREEDAAELCSLGEQDEEANKTSEETTPIIQSRHTTPQQ